MSADLQSLTTPFKRQLADLQSRHATGALSKAQLDLQTAALERRLLDLLLHDTEAPAGQTTGAKASGRLLAGIALVIVLIAGLGYWYKAVPVMEAQVASEGEGAGQPNSAQIIAMVDKLAERLKQDPSDGEGWAMLARSYSVMERNAEALDAYARAVALRKDDPSLLVDYADALAVGRLEAAAELENPAALQQLALHLQDGTMGYAPDPARSELLLRQAAHALRHGHAQH